MTKLLITSFTLLLLSSHIALGAPTWYINSTNNNDAYIYGAGAGASKDEAVKDALSNAISKLRVSVSSKMTTETVATNVGAETDTRQKINTTVSATDINGYDISNFDKDQTGMFFVEIKIDKHQFYEQKYTEFTKELQTVRDAITALDKMKSAVEKIKAFNVIRPNIAKATDLLYLISSLNKNLAFSEYISELTECGKKKSAIISKLKFNIKGNDQMAQVVLENAITEKNYRLSRSFDTQDPYSILMQFKLIQGKKSKLYGSFMSQSSAEVAVFDISGSRHATFTINISGSSTISENGAYVASLNELKAKFATEFTKIGFLTQ